MLVFFWGGGQGGRWAPLLALAPILLALGGTVLGNLLGFFVRAQTLPPSAAASAAAAACARARP